MIIVDTSVWIDHLHRSEEKLEDLLESDAVGLHPMVLTELALGSIARREDVLGLLRLLRRPRILSEEDVLDLIGAQSLHGRGIGVVDAHLLGSTLVTPGARLWTRDKRLRAACEVSGGDVVSWR